MFRNNSPKGPVCRAGMGQAAGENSAGLNLGTGSDNKWAGLPHLWAGVPSRFLVGELMS